MELEELKRKILDLLSNGDVSKSTIAKTLWETSSRKLTLALEELTTANLIYKRGSLYSLQKPEEAPKRKYTKKEVPTKTLETTHGLSVNVLRIVFVVIAVFTTVLSMRNVSVYLMTIYPFPFWAFYAGVLVLFIITGISSTIYLWTHKMKPFACVTGFAAVLAIVYSITCTTIGIYDGSKDELAKMNQIQNTRTMLETQTTDIEDSLKDIDKLIENEQEALDRVETLMVQYDTDEKQKANAKIYNKLYSDAEKSRKFIKDKMAEKLKKRDTKVVVQDKQESVEVYIPTFADRIGMALGLSAVLIEFIIHVIGSILLELLNPVSTYLALFMGKKEE